MAINFIGGNISKNGGDGVRVVGEAPEMNFVGTTIEDNGGQGVNVMQHAPLLEKLGFPHDTPPKEVAELLSQLVGATGPRIVEIEKGNGLLQRLSTTGLNTTTLMANLVTIAATPMAQGLIQQLLQ